MRTRAKRAFLGCVALAAALPACGQHQGYAGALGGLAIVSGDAGTALRQSSPATSVSNPSPGGALNVFAGLHHNNIVSFQADYLWNRNDVALAGLGITGAGVATLYEQTYLTTQHAVAGNVLVYFRPLASQVRPYLSAGGGVMNLRAAPRPGGLTAGSKPPDRFGGTTPTFPVAVGIDIRIRNGWAFRYSFSETVSANLIGKQLLPPGTHVLMTFRNLFGFVKTF